MTTPPGPAGQQQQFDAPPWPPPLAPQPGVAGPGPITGRGRLTVRTRGVGTPTFDDFSLAGGHRILYVAGGYGRNIEIVVEYPLIPSDVDLRTRTLIIWRYVDGADPIDLFTSQALSGFGGGTQSWDSSLPGAGSVVTYVAEHRRVIGQRTERIYENRIDIHMDGLMRSLSLSALTPRALGQATTLAAVTTPTNPPDAIYRYQRRTAANTWVELTQPTYTRTTAGTEEFRVAAWQSQAATFNLGLTGGPGGIDPDLTSAPVAVVWAADLALPAIADKQGERGQILAGNQLPEAAGGFGVITYRLEGLPAGLSFTPGNRTIQPATIPASVPIGRYLLTYRASTQYDNASTQFHLTITDRIIVPDPPDYTGVVTDGITGVGNIPAISGGTGSYSLAWSGLPPGVRGGVGVGQAWYSGEPTVPGSFTPRLIVTDTGTQLAVTSRPANVRINEYAAPVVLVTQSAGVATVSWTAVPGADAYDMEWALVSGVTTPNWTRPVSNRASPRTQQVTGLTAGNTYRFRARGTHTTPSYFGPWGSRDLVIPVPGVPDPVTAGTLRAHGRPGDTVSGELPAGGPGNLTLALVAPPPPNSLPPWLSRSGRRLTAGPLPTSATYPLVRRFQYTVTSDVPGTTPATGNIIITVNAPAVTPPPAVKDVTVSAMLNQRVTGSMAFDEDAANGGMGAGAPHTWYVASPPTGFSPPAGGAASPDFEWPNPTPVGATTIRYSVEDSAGVRSDEATITINVTAPPPSAELSITGPLRIEALVGNYVEEDDTPPIWNAVGGTEPITWTLPVHGRTRSFLPEFVTMTATGRRVTAAGWLQHTGQRFTTLTAVDSSSPPQTASIEIHWSILGRGPGPTPPVRRGPRVELQLLGASGPTGGGPQQEMIDGVDTTVYDLYYGETAVARFRCYDLFIGGGPGFPRWGQAYRVFADGGVTLRARQVDDDGDVHEGVYIGNLIGQGSDWFNQLIGRQTSTVISSSVTVLRGQQHLQRIPIRDVRQYSLDRMLVNPPDGTRVAYRGAFGTIRRSSVIKQTAYRASLWSGHNPRGVRNPPIPLYQLVIPTGRGAGDPYWQTRNYRYHQGTYVTDHIVIVRWHPRPLVWDRTEAGGTLDSGDPIPALPVASGGVGAIKYWLHGCRPPGVTIGDNVFVDGNGATIDPGQDGPYVPTGRVSNAREWGYYPFELIAQDSGLSGDQQIIRQKWQWRVPPP